MTSRPTSSAKPPSGTVTFLFTDIEGSTKLWEQHPKAMSQASARHDAIIESSVLRHDGFVVRPRGEGDSRFAVFARATDAVTAAVDIQRAMFFEFGNLKLDVGNAASNFKLRVRMALHTGAAEWRAGDYYGPEVNRCARLRAATAGGQVLCTQATYDGVRGELPSGVTLRDLGERRLKDLIRPEHIYQLIAPDLPSDFPPLKTLDARPNNLPAPLTSFIGREREIVEVKRLLANARLVTFTGAGGCGKTRLALKVAADLLSGDDSASRLYKDGVWFIELAPLTDPALIAQTIVSTLGLRDETARAPLETLKDYLRNKNALLLFDNCEHMIDASARVADALLHACPNIKILTTSREALGIAGETAYRVPSLACPDPRNVGAGLVPAQDGQPQGRATTSIAPTDLTQYEAVRLFIERAQAAQPQFALAEGNALAVAQLCHQLDGIPLAIELAAARVQALSVEQINERLDDRFRLLTGGSRTALPRQQTLRALVDWSYDLLTESERALLRRLAVFAGGWTLEAAEAVCGEQDGERGQAMAPTDRRHFSSVLETLARLVDKSLVVADLSTEPRYHLLETIRQYARDKLLESDEGKQVRDRHLDFFGNFAKEAIEKLRTLREVWLGRLVEELANLRSASEWGQAAAQTKPEQLAAIYEALGEVYRERGPYQLAIENYERALAIHSSRAEREKGAVLKSKGGIASALEGIASVAAAESQSERALMIAGMVAALRKEITMPLSSAKQIVLERTLAPARQALGADAAIAAWAKGQTMTMEQAIEFAMNDK